MKINVERAHKVAIACSMLYCIALAVQLSSLPVISEFQDETLAAIMLLTSATCIILGISLCRETRRFGILYILLGLLLLLGGVFVPGMLGAKGMGIGQASLGPFHNKQTD